MTGYAGQVSLAQLTLAGVAGFLLATMTTDWSIPFPIAPILAALGATVVGVIVGLPAIRVRGLFVAVVTLAMAYAVQAVWFHNSDYVPAEGKNISGPKLFGLDLRSRVGTDYPRLAFGLLVLGVLVIVAVSVALLRRSRLGSAMLAVRANERSAAGAGINVVRVKILAFAIAAFIAGLGGAMLGYNQGNLTFDPFDVLDRHRRVRDRLPRRDHVGLRRHPRRDAGGRRHRLLRDHPVARPGRLVRDHHRRRPRAHRRAQPRRHRRADPRHAREDADTPRHRGRAGAGSGERRSKPRPRPLPIPRCCRSTTCASPTAASSRSTT